MDNQVSNRATNIFEKLNAISNVVQDEYNILSFYYTYKYIYKQKKFSILINLSINIKQLAKSGIIT